MTTSPTSGFTSKPFLKRLGAETFFEADDGEPAIEIYRQEKPDLVLLDINMPNMDGLAALSKIVEID